MGRYSFIASLFMHLLLAWLYGLLTITLSNTIAVIGISIMPCVSERFYNRSLTLFVGLGIGALTGSAIFQSIPRVCI
jgi:hypothetical protein